MDFYHVAFSGLLGSTNSPSWAPVRFLHVISFSREIYSFPGDEKTTRRNPLKTISPCRSCVSLKQNLNSILRIMHIQRREMLKSFPCLSARRYKRNNFSQLTSDGECRWGNYEFFGSCTKISTRWERETGAETVEGKLLDIDNTEALTTK